MKIHSLCFFIFLLLCSCRNKQSVPQEETASELSFVEIDLESNLTNSGEKMLLSDLVEDVEYIKLETTDASLMAPIWRIVMHRDHLFINTMGVDNSSALIKVFHRSGKFVRDVGRIGQGPGEYRLAIGMSPNDSLLFINANWLRRIMVYNWHNNRFVKGIPLTRLTGPIACLEGNNLAIFPIHNTVFEENMERDAFTTGVINYEGEEKLICKKVIPDKDTACVRGIRIDDKVSWSFENIPNYYDEVNDTIYGITSDSIYPRYALKFGKYKMPLCDYFELKVLLSEGKNYVQSMSFVETSSALYIDFSYKKNKWIAKYNKEDHSVICWSQKGEVSKAADYVVSGGGLYNDIDGGPTLNFRNVLDSKYMYSVFDHGNIDEQSIAKLKAQSVKYPEKQAQLIKLISEQGDDDNPIIALYKLK